jgi:hypothetical protein
MPYGPRAISVDCRPSCRQRRAGGRRYRAAIRCAGGLPLLLSFASGDAVAQVNATYIGSINGSWNVPGAWTGGAVPNNGSPPGTTYNAIVGPDPSTVTIPVGTSFAINNLRVTNGNHVRIDTSFLRIDGTGGAGSINVGNSGSITLISPGGGTGLRINSATILLTGGGTLAMSGNPIIGGFGAATLNNLNAVSVINNGTILASGGTLVLDPPPGGAFVNLGTVRAAGGATVNFSGNGGGTFNFGTGSIDVLGGTTLTTNNNVELTAGAIALAGQWNLQSGTVTVAAVDGTGTLNQAGGVATFQRFRISRVSIAGASLSIAAGGGTIGTSRLTSGTLTITGSGQLNLADHALIVDHTGASPYETVRGYMVSGYAGGSWNGVGINSSTAAAATSLGLGYAEVSSLVGVGTFGGLGVDATTVVVDLSLYGDANLDNVVSIADFSRLATNFNQGPGSPDDDEQVRKDWVDGDFNYNGSVGIDDFGLLASNFGMTEAEAMARLRRGGSAVPEAGVATLLLFSALVRRRR